MVDQREFRTVMSQFATGVVIVTSVHNGMPVGMAVNSFTSVSLDPPLVAFCAARSSTTWPRLREAGGFAVNVLGSHHEEVCRVFSLTGANRFALEGVEWTRSPSGRPLLADALAWLDCQVEAVYPAGDHDIVLGRAMDVATGNGGAPLIFFRGAYTQLSS